MGKWEDRFRERMALLARVVWVQREVTLPSKARRIDFVALLDQEPAVFGALAPLLCDRIVGVEHHSRTIGVYEVVRAWTGHMWMYLRRIRPPRSRGDKNREDTWRSGSRMPIMVITANGVRWPDLEGKLPIMHMHHMPGVAHIPWPSDAGVVIVDATAAESLPGIRWALAIDPNDSNDALVALLADTSIPVETREAVMKAIQSNAIASTPQEAETAYERTRRLAQEEGREQGRKQGLEEGLEEGRAEGRQEGRAEGRREILLSVLRKLDPIGAQNHAQSDLNTLQSLVDRALSSRG